MSADFDVVGYLAEKGYTGRRTSGVEVVYPCFFDCGEEPNSRKKKLYINSVDGWFSCKVCDAHGGTYLLKKQFGDEQDTTEPLPGQNPAVRRKILSDAAMVGMQMLANNDDVQLYLMNERGLSPETILERQLGFVGFGWSLTESLAQNYKADELKASGLVFRDGNKAGKDFFTNHLLIPYQSRGSLVQVRGRVWNHSSGGKYMTGPGEAVRLYNVDDLDDAEDVILVEGEFDAMIVKQTLLQSPEARIRNTAVVGVPGVGALPDGFVDYFQNARRVYIGFDPDDAGKRGAVKVKEMLGSRGRIVELPDGEPKKDWTNLVVKDKWTWRDIAQACSAASGKRLYSVREAGMSFRNSRIQNGEGLKTGYTLLDETILPGLLPGQVMVVLAKTGTGKGHPLGTEIPTPDGWRKWGDLAVGDQVFGSDGRATEVTGVYDRGVLPTYRMTLSDQTVIEVDGEHIHQVMERRGKRREWSSMTMTTEELLAAGLRKGREYRWTVPLPEPVEYPERELPVGPYTMGALLANGYLTGTGAVLTTPDEDVARRVAEEHEVRLHAFDGCPRYGVQGVIGALRAMGVAVPSADKHIPEEYLLGSIAQRRALLHGLMDADGSVRVNKRSVLFHSTSPQLAVGVRELVNSLGGNGSIRRQVRDGYDEYTVSIMLDGCFSSKRKSKYFATKYQTGPRRAIVSIDRIEDQEIRCISVAADDSLYLVGRSYHVTHNTLFLCNVAFAMRNRRVLFISLEMTREEVYDRLRKIYLFHFPTSSDEEVEHALSNVLICDENRLGEKDFELLVDEYEVEMGERPDCVFVDYLGYFARGQKGNSNYEKTTNAVMQLKAEAKKHRVSVITPHQVNRDSKDGKPIELDDARDSGAVEETADFTLGIWRPDDALTAAQSDNSMMSGKLRMGLLKSRHGGKGKEYSLVMDLLTLAIVDDNTPAARRASEHNHLNWRGYSWDDLRRMETAPKQRVIQYPAA